MKSMTERLQQAEEKFSQMCKNVAADAGVPPQPVTTRRPTPIEALDLKIKLPWYGKVENLTPADLTPDLFERLEEYGVFRADITTMFGFKNPPAFYEWMRKNDIQIARRGGSRVKPLRSHDVVVTKRCGKAALEPKEVISIAPTLPQPISTNHQKIDIPSSEQSAGEAGPACGGIVDSGTVIGHVADSPWNVLPKGPDLVRVTGDTGETISITIQNFRPGRDEIPSAEGPTEYIDDPVDLPVSSQSGLATDQHHYNAAGDFQPIEVMQASMPQEQFIGFLRGNVIKYTMRAGRKDDMRREIDKVIQYATWWRQAVDGKTIDPREVAK